MRDHAPQALSSGLAILSPPYDRIIPTSTNWHPHILPPKGKALVWWLVDGHRQQNEYQWLESRPCGMPLFVVLPPAHDLERAMPLLAYVNALHPKAVLPTAAVVAPSYLKTLLALPPRDRPQMVTAYLTRRGLLPDASIRSKVQHILGLVPEVTSVTDLARRLHTSRRTLGRHFSAAGLPVPSHWLQFARLLYATSRLQTEKTTVFRIAARAGYPDGFTLSNQMKRVIGHRPSEIRTLLGWEWVVESWIRTEVMNGGFDTTRYAAAIGMYCP